MAVNVSADLRELGIGVDIPEMTDEAAEKYGLDLNDPDTKALIESFEAERPDPKKLLAEHEAKISAESGNGDADTGVPPSDLPPPNGDTQQLAPPDPGTKVPAPESTAPDTSHTQESEATGSRQSSYVVDFGDGNTVTLDQQQAKSLVTRRSRRGRPMGQRLPRPHHPRPSTWRISLTGNAPCTKRSRRSALSSSRHSTRMFAAAPSRRTPAFSR
jgi:hypothetical protein